MLTTQTCKTCKGLKQVQRLEEYRTDGWFPNTMLPVDVADAWIAKDSRAPLRWNEIECPTCCGTGEYLVEFVKCKIF